MPLPLAPLAAIAAASALYPRDSEAVVGLRGAARAGKSFWTRALEQEEAAAIAAAKAKQIDPRMRSNSKIPLAWTGWDYKPRFEVDTSALKPKSLAPKEKETPITDLWETPPWLAKAYPDLLDYKVIHNPDWATGTGEHNLSDRVITLGLGENPNPQPIRRAMAHELFGHGIASQEGFTPGTSSERMAAIRKLDLNEQIAKNMALGGFKKELSYNPESALTLLKQHSEQFPHLAKAFRSDATNLRTGASDPGALYSSALWYLGQADQLRRQQGKRDTLDNLIQRGLENYTPLFGPRPGDVDPHAYRLYRANAGENEAEIIANRLDLDPFRRYEVPAWRYNLLSPDFLHGVY